jgi:zinc protease
VGIFVPDREVPMVALRLLVRAGSWEDPVGQEGLAHLAAQLLLEGSRRRKGSQIHEAVDDMGARLFVECAADYILLGLTLLREDLDAGMDLLAEILREPAFPEEEFLKKRDKVRGEIAAQEDRPGGAAHRAFLEKLWGRAGYGHDPRGFRESLDGMEISRVRDHYERRILGREAVLVAVGDLDTASCERRMEGLFQGWRREDSETGKGLGGKEAPPSGERTVVVHRDLSQATVLLGQQTVGRNHPDVYALWVMNYILGGGGFDSRLMAEIRSKRGLTYGVSSGLDPKLHGGQFRVALQTKNESVGQARAIVFKEVERIRRALVSQEELRGARNHLVGSFPMRLDSNGAVAFSLALWECYGLGMDYPRTFVRAVEAVTAKDIRAVAQEHLEPERWVQVLVGDRSRMGL